MTTPRSLATAASLAVLISLSGCGGGGGSAEPPGDPFRILVITDTHVRLPGNPDDGWYDNQENLDNLAAAVDRIGSEYGSADLLAVTGDLVGSLFSENPDDYGTGAPNPAETFRDMLDRLPMPYHAVLGNHDYQKSFDPEKGEGISTGDILAIEAVWKMVLGIDPYYSVVHHGVRLLFLNANRGEARSIVCASEEVEAFCTGSFDQPQLDWLADELAAGEPVIVFLHHPLKTDSDDALWAFLDSFLVVETDPVYDLLRAHAGSILAIFAGHGHMFERDLLYGTIPVYETGSIGDGNGHPHNLHLIDVVPADPSVSVTIGREDGMYWGEW